MIKGKKVLLGISGSIAAYKAILIVRLLVKAGAEVKIIMTPAAKDFVSPLTLSTLSKNPVLIDLSDESTWANHVMLGRWADVMLIAPASCNTLAKMAAGICDNLLLAAYLSATCPVVVAPAMDEDMWQHASTINNLKNLVDAKVKIVDVGKGELASGLYGEGRIAEPETITLFLEENFFRQDELKGRKAFVTAGPTYEAIDPVRFIGNHSSGKMGVAIAEVLYEMGADVNLICGPGSVKSRFKGIAVTEVKSANEMYNACHSLMLSAEIAVMAAAVADYTPEKIAGKKIKKSEVTFALQLTRTKDILASLGVVKKAAQVLVGFALETDNEEQNALTKLEKKNADLIVLNSLTNAAAGFGKDTNKVTIFDRNGQKYEYQAKAKHLVAIDIVELIIKKLNEKA